MKILLASPIYCSPWWGPWYDCGTFVMKALHQLGHSVAVWDYRMDKNPPKGSHDYDLAIVWKGEKYVHQAVGMLKCPKFCYWPDKFGRAPLDEEDLKLYDKVFTCTRPTPEGMIWLPTGWDQDFHANLHYPPERRSSDVLFIGTKSERKLRFLSEIKPDKIYGNGWESSWNIAGLVPPRPAIYLQEFVHVLNQHHIVVNVHRDDDGFNSRVFEFVACGFTLTDRVPGTEEVFGKELAAKISFETPKQGKAMVEWYKTRPELREALWQEEFKAIQPYTYKAAVERMISCLS